MEEQQETVCLLWLLILIAYKVSKVCTGSYACDYSSPAGAFLQDAQSLVSVLPPLIRGFTALPLAVMEISAHIWKQPFTMNKRMPNIILQRVPLSKPPCVGSSCPSDPTNPGRQSSEALLKLTNLKGPLCHPSEVEQVNSIPSALGRQEWTFLSCSRSADGRRWELCQVSRQPGICKPAALALCCNHTRHQRQVRGSSCYPFAWQGAVPIQVPVSLAPKRAISTDYIEHQNKFLIDNKLLPLKGTTTSGPKLWELVEFSAVCQRAAHTARTPPPARNSQLTDKMTPQRKLWAVPSLNGINTFWKLERKTLGNVPLKHTHTHTQTNLQPYRPTYRLH